MKPTLVKKSSWPKQTAIVISESPNVHMLLRELLRSYQWSVVDSTPDTAHAIETVRQGNAYLIICDDTAANPATQHMRHLLCDPLSLCTPVLCFLLDAHKSEHSALNRMAPTSIVEKPLTPSKFVPGFIQLVRSWEREPLSILRRANYHFLDGNDALGLKTLVKLCATTQLDGNTATSATAAQALSLHLRRLGKVKEAENILLAALKKRPRELGNVFALVDLYLHYAMPKLAHRLLLGIRGTYGQSLAVIPDLVQASLMMGNLDEAITHLQVLQKAGYREKETTTFLARLLFAEGREAEAERVLSNNKTTYKRLETAWTAADAPQLGAAG